MRLHPPASLIALLILSGGTLLANPDRLFTVHMNDFRVREFNPTTGAYFTEIGLTDALGPFHLNSDIEFDGTYYYSLYAGSAIIRQFNAAGVYITDFATLKDGNNDPLLGQIGLAYDGVNFFTISAGNATVRRFDLSGNFLGDYAVLRDGGVPTTTQTGIATDGTYFYSVADGDFRVRQFAMTTPGFLDYQTDIAGLTDGGPFFMLNSGVAVTPTPEPSSTLLLAGAGLGLLLRRRRKS